MSVYPKWAELPALPLANVYEFLSKRDRLSASLACWHWRSVLFQKSFFRNFKFHLHIKDERQRQFFLRSLVNLTNELIIIFDFSNVYHIDMLRRLLYKLARTECLQGIRFQTNSVGRTPPDDVTAGDLVKIERSIIEPLKLFIARRRPALKILDLGGIESFTYYGTDFLKAIPKPQDLQEITLASIKYDHCEYPILSMEHVFFEKCTSLQVLSLDYDTLNEDILRTIQILPLKTLMICVHGLDGRNDDISEEAWADFASKFKSIKLVLTLIYAYEAVESLQDTVFKRNMPVSHLRVLFCNYINKDALEFISRYYNNTIRSIQWIDSAAPESQKNVMDLFVNPGTDPFVMMSWRCKNIEEIVIHGYMLDPHNLVGISRLLGNKLKKLEVSMIDSPASKIMQSVINEISTQLAQKWRPIDRRRVHPALGSIPVNDDVRDSFIYDLIRSDLCN